MSANEEIRNGMELGADHPVPFGYKIAWLAIPTEETTAVVAALRLRHPRLSPWAKGIEQAYGSRVFVTPAISGWTLAVGRALPFTDDPSWIPFLVGLSTVLGHVQYFGTYRNADAYAWAKADNGRIIRAYAYPGGKAPIDIGDKTEAEIELGLDVLTDVSDEEVAEEYWERDEFASPDEESVMKLAEKWSVNPTQLARYESKGLGILGDLPSRTEEAISQ